MTFATNWSVIKSLALSKTTCALGLVTAMRLSSLDIFILEGSNASNEAVPGVEMR